MLSNVRIQNVTRFSDVSATFAALNVIHGTNGAGKTHLLKLLYAMAAVASTATAGDEHPVRTRMNRTLAEKLMGVFKLDPLGSLVRHGAKEAEVALRFSQPEANFDFKVGARAKAEVDVGQVPPAWRTESAIYLPPRELLSLQPTFAGLAADYHLPFDDTWLDTSRLLNRPLPRGPKGKLLQAVLRPLEDALGGELITDVSGRFKLKKGRYEIDAPMLAEGHRKIATLLRLLDNKELREGSVLCWDEPEANLNPRLIKALVPALVGLADLGVQIFLATHSLFLLRELEIVQARQKSPVPTRYFGLHDGPEGVSLEQGDTLDDAGDLAALDESLEQSQRYLDGAP